jgi:hypothetical protein
LPCFHFAHDAFKFGQGSFEARRRQKFDGVGGVCHDKHGVTNDMNCQETAKITQLAGIGQLNP